MSLINVFQKEHLKQIFGSSLCRGELGFTEDGYLTQCFCSTYLFTPVVLILTAWAIKETKSLATDAHPANTMSGRVKFFLTSLYTAIIVTQGANIFNTLAIFASYATLSVIFVLSYMELKGVDVPQKPLEAYFFVAAVYSGYLFVQFIGTYNYTPALNSAVYVCLISSVAGAARNILSAFDDAVETKQKKE